MPRVSGAAIETRMTRHDRDGRTHPLAQRTPAVREAATDRGVVGGDEAIVAGGVNVGGRATGPTMKAGAEAGAEGGGVRAAHVLDSTTPRSASASAPAPAPPSRETSPTASGLRHGELRCEPTLSGCPANPPPPSGEPGGARDDAGGDASLAPAPQGNEIPAANGIPALFGCSLTRTGTGSHELTDLSETPESSIGASSLDGDTTLPHRVLICWREGCGRYSTRQSGGPNNAELYRCVPCAQLEGHSDRCGRAYLQHALLGGWPDPLPGHDAHPRGPDLAEAGSWGTRWRSRTIGTSATGAPVDGFMVDAPLSAGRISPASEPPPARGTIAGVLGPAAPPAAVVPPAAADVMANAATRPQSDPHGDGVRVGGSGVPAPGAGAAGADGTGDGLTDGLALRADGLSSASVLWAPPRTSPQ